MDSSERSYSSDWALLAVQLWTELEILPPVFGKVKYRQMEQVLEHARDHYFVELNPIEPR